MVFHAKLQKEILNYSMIIFEHSMADNHILTKVFLITFGYTQYLKDLIIFQLTRKLKNKTPGESGIMTQIWKNLLDCRETFSMLKSIVIKFWMTEIVPEDLSLPKKLQRNYSHYSPCQNATDGGKFRSRITVWFQTRNRMYERHFTISMALKRRQEHGLDSWVLLLGLVKTFNFMPREILWKLLAKFYVPNKIISYCKSYMLILLLNLLLMMSLNLQTVLLVFSKMISLVPFYLHSLLQP